MPAFEKTYGRTLVNELSELRNEALQASYMRGSRRELGRLSIGTVQAAWFPEEGRAALLHDGGFRVNGYFPTLLFSARNRPPTILTIASDYEEGDENSLVTRFSMDLYPRAGFIDVYHHLAPESQKQLKKEQNSRIKNRITERRLGLAMPTEEELSLLRSEMERGASGAYAIKGLYDD